VNVTEHTATSLCSRCQHRYGRWQRASDGGDLQRFLAEVTQTRSEDLERLCLVCRTPGHERPVAAQGVCYSCVRQASNRGQSVAAYVAGDERWPPATPRPSFGLCRMTCDALACGSDGLCGEHLRHWRRAGRPAGAAFEAWRAQVGEPLPASRYVDLSGLGDRVRWELLLGLSVAIDEHRRTRISELRRVVSLIGQRNVASIAELDVTGVRTQGVRLFIMWVQDRLRLAFADPDRAFAPAARARRDRAVARRRCRAERERAAVPAPGRRGAPAPEPSNVKARGHGCEYRYRCVGCEHFRTDPQAELRDYLHQQLAGRERLAAAVPQLADWARRDATPSDEEIAALRALIRRNDQIIDELDPSDRAAVLEAIATTRRFRAQLRVTIPDRFKGVTRPPRPTLVPRPAGRTG